MMKMDDARHHYIQQQCTKSPDICIDYQEIQRTSCGWHSISKTYFIWGLAFQHFGSVSWDLMYHVSLERCGGIRADGVENGLYFGIPLTIIAASLKGATARRWRLWFLVSGELIPRDVVFWCGR